VIAAGGMKIIPDYTLQTAPAPKVIVIPAQSNSSEAVLEWIRKSSKTADVTMSVCTGAYLLAKTGLLAGKAATTHHGAYVDLALKYPDIQVKRGARFVEDGNVASSGGLSSGMDLSLRVVERYYGRAVAEQTAYDMEYQGQGWMNADSNSVYSKVRTSANNRPVCTVCSMDIDLATAPKSVYKDKTYYFCSPTHKGQFDATPGKILGFRQRTVIQRKEWPGSRLVLGSAAGAGTQHKRVAGGGIGSPEPIEGRQALSVIVAPSSVRFSERLRPRNGEPFFRNNTKSGAARRNQGRLFACGGKPSWEFSERRRANTWRCSARTRDLLCG